MRAQQVWRLAEGRIPWAIELRSCFAARGGGLGGRCCGIITALIVGGSNKSAEGAGGLAGRVGARASRGWQMQRDLLVGAVQHALHEVTALCVL